MQRSGTLGSMSGAGLLMLFGAALSGGCALVYSFDYKSSGAGGGSGSSSGPSSSSSGSSNASTGSSSSSGSTGGGGGGSGSGLPDPLWQVKYGGAGVDMAGHRGIDFSPGLEVFITGIFTDSINLGNGPLPLPGMNFFLARMDPLTGKALWNNALADSTGTVSTLAATAGAEVVVAGSFYSAAKLDGVTPVPTKGLHDIFLARFDKDGACLWHHEYGDSQEQYANAVVVDAAGRIYLTGSFGGTFNFGSASCAVDATDAGASNSAFVAQFDPNGTCLWVRQFGGQAVGTALTALDPPAPTPKGIVVGGTFVGTISLDGKTITSMNLMNPAPYVLVFNATSGALINQQSFMGTNIELTEDVSTSGALFGITSLGGPNTNIGFGVVEKDGLTITNPPMELGGTTTGTLESIARRNTGELFMTGYFANGDLTLGKPIQNKGAEDIFLARLDANNALLDGAGYGDVSNQFGRNVRADQGGNVYLFGDFKGSVDFGKGPLMSGGGSDIFLIKFAYNSFSTP